MALGCAGTGTYTVTASTPELAYVGPEVSVVADYDYPVFYSHNYYWRNDGGRWYRSRYYNRGFSYYAAPPRAVVTIDRPHRYVRYRSRTVDRRPVAPVRDYRRDRR